MPGKARRVASRQAQLGRRRKRQQSRPEDGQPVASPSEPSSAEPVEIDEQDIEPSTVEASVAMETPGEDVPKTPTPQARPTPRPPRPSPVAARGSDGELVPARGGARGRRERVSAQANIGAEIKRILAMSSTVLAVIIVLGIVL